jgi:hypothetical protein
LLVTRPCPQGLEEKEEDSASSPLHHTLASQPPVSLPSSTGQDHACLVKPTPSKNVPFGYPSTGRCPTCPWVPGRDGRTRLSSHQRLFSLAPLPSSFGFSAPRCLFCLSRNAPLATCNGLLSFDRACVVHDFGTRDCVCGQFPSRLPPPSPYRNKTGTKLCLAHHEPPRRVPLPCPPHDPAPPRHCRRILSLFRNPQPPVRPPAAARSMLANRKRMSRPFSKSCALFTPHYHALQRSEPSRPPRRFAAGRRPWRQQKEGGWPLCHSPALHRPHLPCQPQ